jgi:hypothetical protein
MNELGQQRYPVRSGLIRNMGIILFVLSFIVPPGGAYGVPTMGEHFRDYLQPFWGCRVFINTPFMVTFLPLWRGEPIDSGFTPYEIFIRVILIGAWLTNFTILFRLPLPATLLTIALPWLAFLCWFEIAARFIPFYFWALGITFIHLSRILRPWPGTALESPRQKQPAL